MIVTVAITELSASAPHAMRVSDGFTLVLCQLDGNYYAFEGKCPHRGAPLAEGELAGELIICPLHHFKFNLKTGRCVMPRHLKLRSFAVSRDGDQLAIDVKDAAEPAAADTAPAGMPDPAG